MGQEIERTSTGACILPSHPGKYAALSRKGDLLVVSKAQAGEFPESEAPRRQKELERRGFKTKIEPRS